MEPIPANTALYRQHFGLYKDLYAHLKGDYLRLAGLRASR
jgi:hypothetical protein